MVFSRIRYKATILVDLLLRAIYAVSFQVTVPEVYVVSVRGRPVVLGCAFTPDLEADPSFPNLVVTWQRQEDSRVVHSFYYGQDQLKQQSAAYRNRTALFISELGSGNASLQIQQPGVEDVGRYLCVVSTKGGSGNAQVRLDHAAFYTEPHMSVIVNSSTMIVQYEAEGFPKPEVHWLGEQGEELVHHINLSTREEGLYRLTTHFVTVAKPLNITFVLKNALLKQHLERPMYLHYSGWSGSCDAVITTVIALAVICALLCIVVLLQHCRK